MDSQWQMLWLVFSLLLVIGIIFAMALVAKRFFGAQLSSQGHIRVLAMTALGQKEKLAVVEVGDQQLLLGVTPQQITLLCQLQQPLSTAATDQSPFAKKLTSMLRNKTHVEDMDTRTNGADSKSA